ncbi:hypothetical protein [Stutzerimonas chloritidismutans]|uniref:hypothetical protein n=1 Tax=Stutzerimonas chloritidismutans TaxID=203192 RepID=UPI00384B088F
MSSTKQIVEQSRDVAVALARAMGTSFGREVTAYLTDAYLVAGCCVGVVLRHVRADVYGRFQDGHRVRTSDVLKAHEQGGFWALYTATGSLYVIVTFIEGSGRQSLDVLLEQRAKGMHATPARIQ